jgi:hypothetical protein
MLNILSWSGCILLLYGLKLIGEKKIYGFYITFTAEALWVIWGIMNHSWAVVVMSLCIMAMYIRSIYLWRKAKSCST